MALALAAVLASGVAHAQILTRSSGGATCVPLEDRGCTSDASCSTGEICRLFPPDARLCTPREAFFCCSDAGDCPATRADEDSTTCTGVSGLSGGAGACLPDRDYCGTSSIAAILDCHTSPRGVLVRSWDFGDCDRDGVANGLEVSGGTDVCERPGPVAAFDGTTCRPLETGCVPGDTCLVNDGAGVCLPTGDGAGTFCAPHDGALYCCGSTVCPDPGAVCVVTERAALCVDSLCVESDLPDLTACIMAGDAIVGFDEGDCDSDGVSNGEEMNVAGTDPCVDEDAIEADGGSSDADGGGTSMRADGGTPPTPGLDVRFEGGGGCACRAAPAVPGPAPWMLLAGLGIAILRRR